MGANSEIINPSTFNRRITVKRTIATVGAGGGVEQTVETLFETWASVDSLSTSRKVYLGLDAFESFYSIRLRYNADRKLSADMLIAYEDKILRIKSVQLVRQSFKMFSDVIANEVSVN